MRATQIERRFIEKNSRVLVGTKLTMSQQSVPLVKKANGIIGSIRNSMASMFEGGDLEPCTQFWAAQYNTSMDIMESLARCHKNGQGTGASIKQKQRERGLFSLEKRRLRGDLISVHRYLKGAEDGARLFSVVLSARIRGNGHRGFPLNTRIHFCAVWVMVHWHRLLRDCGDLQKPPGHGPGCSALGALFVQGLG